MRTSPLILIEDDEDDQFLIQTALSELNVTNPLLIFNNGQEGLEYLLSSEEQPFLILCDVNMPIMNGLELRQHIEDIPILRNKAVPFVFLTTADSAFMVKLAYATTIQGFFKKQLSFAAAKAQLSGIIHYWQGCLHPNNVD